jgi:hypothetical protein
MALWRVCAAVTAPAIGFGPGTNCARHIEAARRPSDQRESQNFHGATFLGWRPRQRHSLTVTIVRRRSFKAGRRLAVERTRGFLINLEARDPGNGVKSRKLAGR